MRIQMLILSFTLLFLSPVFGGQKTVCTATLNSADEKELFQKKLNKSDFRFVELTDYNTPGAGANDWFERACESGLQCDVLIVSGHFGGSFFGSSASSLPLKTLES